MSKSNRRTWQGLVVILIAILTTFTTSTVTAARKIRNFPDTTEILLGTKATETPGILPFTGSYQLVLGDLDNLQRPTFAHIQLKDQDEPNIKRKGLKFNPPGWHNYKLTD
ncbi:TPA: streptodornase Sda3, partial [Streptococcus pyogenes]|nr:streptodornase Sda3 [Streptococcus pyogenes]